MDKLFVSIGVTILFIFLMLIHTSMYEFSLQNIIEGTYIMLLVTVTILGAIGFSFGITKLFEKTFRVKIL